MFTADAALGYQLRPWLQPEIEVNYCSYFFQEEENGQQLAVTGGLVMPVNETLPPVVILPLTAFQT